MSLSSVSQKHTAWLGSFFPNQSKGPSERLASRMAVTRDAASSVPLCFPEGQRDRRAHFPAHTCSEQYVPPARSRELVEGKGKERKIQHSGQFSFLDSQGAADTGTETALTTTQEAPTRPICSKDTRSLSDEETRSSLFLVSRPPRTHHLPAQKNRQSDHCLVGMTRREGQGPSRPQCPLRSPRDSSVVSSHGFHILMVAMVVMLMVDVAIC